MKHVFLIFILSFLNAHAGLPIYENELLPFSTDGCSVIPDFKFSQCCIIHDYAYWVGGTSEEREIADEELSKCVNNKSFSGVGHMFYLGVQLGGAPFLKTNHRWGYGWKYYRGYGALTLKEQQIVANTNFSLNDALKTSITEPGDQLLEYPSISGDYCLDESRNILAQQFQITEAELDNIIIDVEIKSGNIKKGQVTSNRVYKIYTTKCDEPMSFNFGRKRSSFCKKMRKINHDHSFVRSYNISDSCLNH